MHAISNCTGCRRDNEHEQLGIRVAMYASWWTYYCVNVRRCIEHHLQGSDMLTLLASLQASTSMLICFVWVVDLVIY